MKNRLFLDMDSTITDSLSTYINTYNILYNRHPDFVKADASKVKRFDIKDQCPLVDNPLDIFKHQLFFQLLEFMPNAEEVIKELCKKYQTIICSIGCLDNIYHKTQFIKNRMPYIKDAVLLTNNGIKMSKEIVNMDGAIFYDDVKSNLDSSNAKYKFLFGKRFDWNKDWNGLWCPDWLDIADVFL